MLIPKEDFEIQNTWKTVAQRGTGSNNILLRKCIRSQTSYS